MGPLGVGRPGRSSLLTNLFVTFTISVCLVYLAIVKLVIIKFLAREGVQMAEIFQRLTSQLGNELFSKIHVFAWCKQFKNGQECVEMKVVSSPS